MSWKVKKTLDDVHQEGETSMVNEEEHNWNFDAVRVKNINLDSIKCVISTKLESSPSQR